MPEELLREISDWKLDAKFEAIERHFYNIREVQDIKDGIRSFVIGRKGSGKTARKRFCF